MASLNEMIEKLYDELFYSRKQSSKVEEIIDRVNSLKYTDGKALSSSDKLVIFKGIKKKFERVKPIIKEADNAKYLEAINHAQSLLNDVKERLNNEIETIENLETNKDD